MPSLVLLRWAPSRTRLFFVRHCLLNVCRTQQMYHPGLAKSPFLWLTEPMTFSAPEPCSYSKMREEGSSRRRQSQELRLPKSCSLQPVRERRKKILILRKQQHLLGVVCALNRNIASSWFNTLMVLYSCVMKASSLPHEPAHVSAPPVAGLTVSVPAAPSLQHIHMLQWLGMAQLRNSTTMAVK